MSASSTHCRGSSGTTAFGVQQAAIGVAIIGFLLFEPDGLIEIYRRIAIYFERWPFRYRETQGERRAMSEPVTQASVCSTCASSRSSITT